MPNFRMKVLGIDTSTLCGSVGLIEEDEMLSDSLLKVLTTHSETLIRAIDFVLAGSGLSLRDLNGLAVSLGPGSFTGLRIGISTAKGFALATGLPVVGMSTLDVLASQVAPTPFLICPILDARKGEVYTAFYRYGQAQYPTRLTPYEAVRPEELVKRIQERTVFIGDGLRTYRGHLQASLPSMALFAPDPLNRPLGSMVARLGLESLRNREVLDLSTFAPIYVRPSEAELKWKQAHPV